MMSGRLMTMLMRLGTMEAFEISWHPQHLHLW